MSVVRSAWRHIDTVVGERSPRVREEKRVVIRITVTDILSERNRYIPSIIKKRGIKILLR